jgi:hypothetical protein
MSRPAEADGSKVSRSHVVALRPSVLHSNLLQLASSQAARHRCQQLTV